MPKMDKASSLAIEILGIRSEISDMKDSLEKAHDELSANLIAQSRASVRVTYEGESYTLEVQHIDEHEKIKIKKG